MYPPVPISHFRFTLSTFTLVTSLRFLFRVSATVHTCILGLVHKTPAPDVWHSSLDLELGLAFPVYLPNSRQYHQGFCGPLAILSGNLQALVSKARP